MSVEYYRIIKEFFMFAQEKRNDGIRDFTEILENFYVDVLRTLEERDGKDSSKSTSKQTQEDKAG